MFKDMKTGPYCRQHCYESKISIEMFWSKGLYLCMKMMDTVNEHPFSYGNGELFRKPCWRGWEILLERLGNPVREVGKPCCGGLFP